jgi:hypothetical protein
MFARNSLLARLAASAKPKHIHSVARAERGGLPSLDAKPNRPIGDVKQTPRLLKADDTPHVHAVTWHASGGELLKAEDRLRSDSERIRRCGLGEIHFLQARDIQQDAHEPVFLVKECAANAAKTDLRIHKLAENRRIVLADPYPEPAAAHCHT